MARKVYINVTSTFTKDGTLLPLYFLWEDGTRYDVDKVFDFQKAASLKVGGQGIRYRCRDYRNCQSLKQKTNAQRFYCMCGGQKFQLFFEDGGFGNQRFYIELK